MKKWQQQIRSILIHSFALPSDVILELPRITVIGQIHAYIENHDGLTAFSDTELILKMKKGSVKITGESFVLKMMLPEEILLEGTITDVKFIPG
ncbi:MAG TPA: sporulation protein YqfC [Bacillota bacterium]|nr:sporulation protein YqfC [Bacillota bacterium]